MAARQVAGGREVTAFDLSETAIAKVVGAGATGAKSVAEAVKTAEAVITMLPAGPHVRKVYADDILPHAPRSALLIDCSTIDVDSARAVAQQAKAAGFRFADAPVSGGTAGADAGTLAFMVGCDEADFASVEEMLKPMARVTIRAGDHGAGQAAKICNNMLLGISMIGTCEAFALAEKLGLAPDRFFEIASKSSGNCWSLSTYAPWPGVGPVTASDRNYEGGFAAAMMLKDLKLAQEAAARAGATTPLGNSAEAIYQLFDRLGFGGKDFSGVLQMLRGNLTAL
jgi:3-hydroxyisobutyrate dehydrogenase